MEVQVVAKNSASKTIDELSRQIAEAIADAFSTQPAAFLIDQAAMKAIMFLREKAKNCIEDRDAPRIKPELIKQVLDYVWDDAKLLRAQDMDQIVHGLKLAEDEADAHHASSTGMWKNAY
jgi:dephospho-CoA kinase